MPDLAKPKPEGVVSGLAEAITSLRAELTTAMHAAKGQELQFELGTVHMEFEVEATADVTARGGVRFWVVELGADGKVGRTGTHTVKLELKPISSGGKPAIVSDDD
jgi:hypothetical protein